MECNLDAKVYNFGLVCIIEVMGRNAGWLAASAALADASGLGADLIYLPEIPFSIEKFVQDVFNVCERNEGKCIAVVAEGLKDENGKCMSAISKQERTTISGTPRSVGLPASSEG